MNTRYFALADDGQVYDLCDCGDFEAAEESAADLDINAIWIADEATALQWADRILDSTFGVTTTDLADWGLTEEDDLPDWDLTEENDND